MNHRTHRILALPVLTFMCLTGCKVGTDPVVTDGAIGELPSSLAEVNESVCVGVSPDPSAWMADAFPIRFPQVDEDAQQGQGDVTDIIADVASETSPSPGEDRGAAAPPAEPEGEVQDQEPCVAEPGTCLEAPPPEWALLDFQSQSCGSGATYGLSAFHGHVTVMALFASW